MLAYEWAKMRGEMTISQLLIIPLAVVFDLSERNQNNILLILSLNKCLKTYAGCLRSNSFIAIV